MNIYFNRLLNTIISYEVIRSSTIEQRDEKRTNPVRIEIITRLY